MHRYSFVFADFLTIWLQDLAYICNTFACKRDFKVCEAAIEDLATPVGEEEVITFSQIRHAMVIVTVKVLYGHFIVVKT